MQGPFSRAGEIFNYVEVGLWLAPLALVAFATSLLAGRLSARVPLRGAIAAGMALTAGGLILMRGITPDSSWAHLLLGLAVTGAGTGLANPLVTFAHLGVLPPAQGGLASGINNTARQLGLAVGVAVLGALLQGGIADRVATDAGGLGESRAAVREQIQEGDIGAATALAPAPAREQLRVTYDAAFADGLNELLLIAAALALVGLVAAVVLVRARDLWRPEEV